MKKFYDNGLLFQINYFLGSLILLAATGLIYYVVFIGIPSEGKLDWLSAFGSILLLLASIFTVYGSITFMFAALLPPTSKYAQMGLKFSLNDEIHDDADSWFLYIIAFFVFIISIIIYYPLKMLGIKGYPIELYDDFWAAEKERKKQKKAEKKSRKKKK